MNLKKSDPQDFRNLEGMKSNILWLVSQSFQTPAANRHRYNVPTSCRNAQ